MKHEDITLVEQLKVPDFWLLAIATGLLAIHLTLTLRANDGSLLASSLLYWAAIASLIWSKRETLNLESNIFSTILGLLLIALVLIKSTFLIGFDPFLRISPLISALGIALTASGFKGLKQYWQELLILCFLAPPPSVLSELIDTSPVTARLSTLLLWYGGFDVVRQGVNIVLPNGGVEVYSGCSGIENMFHLLGLSILFLATFPTHLIQKIFVPIVALSIAFFVNGFRVALMAILAASTNKVAFEYWHKGEGSLIFSMISVMLFGIFCFFVLQQEDSNDPDLVESE
jgi:cyanoexosortase A